MSYRTPMVTGDRVALAPHTDLWMAGVRFGDCEEVYISRDGFLRYMVRVGPSQVFIAKHDDLLGAVAGTPVGGERGGARRSTEYDEHPIRRLYDEADARVLGQPEPDDDDDDIVRNWLLSGWTP